RDIEGEDGTLDFRSGCFYGLSGFLGHGAGKFFFTFSDALRHAAQHSLALESRQPARGAEGFYGGGDCSLGVFACALIYLGDHVAVEWRSYLLEVALLDSFAIVEKTLGADGCHGHLG